MTKENNDVFDIIQTEINKEMEKIYSKICIEYANNPLNLGRMNDPSTAAWIKGSCGDTMEIYLVIENKKITHASFFTDGCGATLACGSAITLLIKGKTIDQTLSISPQHIIDHLQGLPGENLHCAILAVSTLHKAIAEYLLRCH